MKMQDYMLQTAKNKKKQKQKEKGTVRGEIDYSGGPFGMGQGMERVHEAVIESISPGVLDKTVKPGFVPVGLDSSLFALNKKNLNPGQMIRRNYLDANAPKLQKALKKRNIFAYNAAMANLREGISRTEGGPRLAKEMPDQMEQRRLARIRQARLPVGSREANMLGAF